MHVSRLRRKLADAGAPEEQVKTIRGAGYQLAINLDSPAAKD
ncbi:MAG: winged helix-turn-helix domain-containing protein, partial [Acidobacteriota bacterium]|nr:winged helix-turn-helix domain-containing protein [Acidobacteriota bacterium]